MAVGLFRARLQKERADWRDWRIDSAGTWALEGEMAAKNSRLVMAERGLDIADHRARSVTEAMLKEYALILTMEPNQKEALQVEFPSVARRVYLLSEMAGEVVAVEDPIGGPIEDFRAAVATIDQILSKGMPRMINLATSDELQTGN
jgi:protein-tyrosine phosphatase